MGEIHYFPHMYPACPAMAGAVKLEYDAWGSMHENAYYRECSGLVILGDSLIFPCKSASRLTDHYHLRANAFPQTFLDARV